MSPTEIAGRVGDRYTHMRWMRRLPDLPQQSADPTVRVAPPGAISDRPDAVAALVESADRLLDGTWPLFGHLRSDVTADVDYYVDPVSGRSAPHDTFFSTIDHRDEARVGNIKFTWELARHQHLSMLAAAYFVTKHDRYADRIVEELDHFRRVAPFPLGVHWTSGIEIGIRLISWAWIRRLLDDWAPVGRHFEDNPSFRDQLARHQQWLDALHAKGSSANNHLIAELCGQFVAATVFDFYEDSARWRSESGSRLVVALDEQTFRDGLNKELASDYHAFVLELAVSAQVEASLSSDPVADQLRPILTRAFDALAATLDQAGQPHHQGDSDDAHGFLLDPLAADRIADLMAIGATLVGRQPWWPDLGGGNVRAAIVDRLLEPAPAERTPTRPSARPSHFPDAGLTFLRSDESDDGIWLRFDHGPLGYLSTAAHGHADALSIEVRHRAVPILIDPGTYCYHGEPAWRDYFRGTAAHNTVTIGGQNQSRIAGPFLWTQKAHCTLISVGSDRCSAEHDGYVERFGITHRRSVELQTESQRIELIDSFGADADTSHPATIAFHFGPDVTVALVEGQAELNWSEQGNPHSAALVLDQDATWTLSHGESEPPLGWMSPVFGTKIPTNVLVGQFNASVDRILRTTVVFATVVSEPESSEPDGAG